jgi:hypothetical protein
VSCIVQVRMVRLIWVGQEAEGVRNRVGKGAEQKVLAVYNYACLVKLSHRPDT